MKHIINLLFFVITIVITGIGNTCTDMPNATSAKLMAPIKGSDKLLIGAPQTEVDLTVPTGIFEVMCLPAKMAFDDPIVFPNMPGNSHLHVFFGNTSINANTDLMSLRLSGNSTCLGGIGNRSSYWFPALIDTKNNIALTPADFLIYYKGSPREYKDSSGEIIKTSITPFPIGLRFIAGNATAKTIEESGDIALRCTGSLLDLNTSKVIPECVSPNKLSVKIFMPECWDGINLDSLDHKSHMTYASRGTGRKCPATHPIQLPQLTLRILYKPDLIDGTKYFKFSSDNYPSVGYNAGLSYHADFVNGWDVAIHEKVVNNCLNKGIQCRSNLNDGTGLLMIPLKDRLPL